MKKRLSIILTLLVFFAGCGCDISTKNWARKNLENKTSLVLIEKILELRYVENDSTAFSLLHNVDLKIKKPLLTILPILVLLFFLIYLYRIKDFSLLNLFTFAFISSGAMGNIFDRLRFGYVVDFIHLHYKDTFNWPVFNVADMLVCAGAALLLISFLKNRKEEILPGHR